MEGENRRESDGDGRALHLRPRRGKDSRSREGVDENRNDPDLCDVMTFEDAARVVGRHRRAVKDLAIRSGIAINWGGSDAHPRLRVKLSELKEVILRDRFTPQRKPVR